MIYLLYVLCMVRESTLVWTGVDTRIWAVTGELKYCENDMTLVRPVLKFITHEDFSEDTFENDLAVFEMEKWENCGQGTLKLSRSEMKNGNINTLAPI